MTEKTVRVYMLGNVAELETGKYYDLPMLRANALCGIGQAIMAETAATPAQEEK